MNAPGTALVWVCAAITALPLAPCAFFPSDCREHSAVAKSEVAADAQRPCCAEHAAPAKQNDDHDSDPCSGECCRLSPFVPVEKVPLDGHLWALFVMLPAVADAAGEHLTVAPVVLRPPVSLQVLHCQWRC